MGSCSRSAVARRYGGCGRGRSGGRISLLRIGSMSEGTSHYRFVTERQLKYMNRLNLPAVIVPLGIIRADEGEYVLDPDGLALPAPSVAVAQELLEIAQAAGTWRFVPGGEAICVEPRDDCRD